MDAGRPRGAHALIPVRDAVAWARTLTWRWQKWTHTFQTSRRRGDKDFSKDGRKLTLTEMKTTVGGAHWEERGAIKIQVVEIHTYKLFPPLHVQVCRLSKCWMYQSGVLKKGWCFRYKSVSHQWGQDEITCGMSADRKRRSEHGDLGLPSIRESGERLRKHQK